MVDLEGIFRDFQRAHRPLSRHLDRTFTEPMLATIREYNADDLARPGAEIVSGLVDAVRTAGPTLLGAEVASTHEGDWRPGSERGVRVGTSRHHVAVQVFGDIDMLEHWPDRSSAHLKPIDEFDDDPWAEDFATEPYDEVRAVRRHGQRQTQKLWFLARRDEHVRALYTFIDLTLDEEADVAAGRIDPRAVIDARRDVVEPIVDAIREQAAAFFEVDLPRVLAEALDNRRARVAARAAVRSNLAWPVGWKFDEPKLADPDPPPSDDHTPTEVVIEHRSRLAPATFQDVQRTIRIWADAVERYPRAFRGLGEDPLSDLLAATLNASVPGAGREVYSRGGKTDIFIRADVLNEGLGPAKVFICESKWWGGPKKAVTALDQLLGYLEVKDTAAILIFFVRTTRAKAVRATSLRTLTALPTYEGLGSETVDGWPILRFRDRDRRVDVCTAFVDLPPV